MRRALLTIVLPMLCAAPAVAAKVELTHLRAPTPYVEVRGLSAGPFRPLLWQRGTLHWVQDARWPILPPAPGPLRNIYAPTVVPIRSGYRIYFGGWDGSQTPNDRLYTATTDPEFQSISPHQLTVDNGRFVHVNNCSAVRLQNGTTYIAATCYPDEAGTNKPALFVSKDGVRFGAATPYAPTKADLVPIHGYESFADADINGMNALLREDGVWRLYFGDFHQFGKVYRATSRDARTFQYDGPVLDAALMVNDVHQFVFGGQRWSLMLLHHNDQRLSYTLSTTSAHFPPASTLFQAAGNDDRYIVAVGLVTDGRRALGVLYGAGAVPSLDQNRIFARWLQKRAQFEASGRDLAADGRALGPDRLRFAVPPGVTRGRFVVYDEDGATRLYEGPEVELRQGQVWTFRRG